MDISSADQGLNHRILERENFGRAIVNICASKPKRRIERMSHRGFSHIGLSTLDLDKTREFYEGVLGFEPVVCNTITIEEGGKIRHIFFDTAMINS
jgi:hypothetical protein